MVTLIFFPMYILILVHKLYISCIYVYTNCTQEMQFW